MYCQTQILSGDYLINNNICITKKVINLYISYILNSQLRCLKTDFTLDNCLFGSVKLTKNADLDKLNIAATAQDLLLARTFHLQMEAWEKNIIIFGADMSSSMHIDNKNNDILILGEDPTQELDGTTLKRECYKVNATKLYQLKAKGSKIKGYALFLGNISKDFTINNMKTKQNKTKQDEILLI